MHETATFSLHSWEGFYVIVGAAAGALTGLQFVVMTLIGEAGRFRSSGETLSAFGTPNVVHFCAALLLSAIMTAPWRLLLTWNAPPCAAGRLIDVAVSLKNSAPVASRVSSCSMLVGAGITLRSAWAVALLARIVIGELAGVSFAVANASVSASVKPGSRMYWYMPDEGTPWLIQSMR